MKRKLLYLSFFASAVATTIVLLCRGMRDGRMECAPEGSGHVVIKQQPDARMESEIGLDTVKRLESSSLEEAANIANDMLRSLSEQPSMLPDKDAVIEMICAAEKLESRRISLADGVSVAAREFDRLEGDDFTFAVNSICALRMFCAKASAKFEGVGDVASELWLVYFLTRAKMRLCKAEDADRVRMLDYWLGEAWSFIDSRDSSVYKATKKLWDDGLQRILASNDGDEYCEAFVNHVRKSFIDRIAKTGNGHVVPWEGEFTFSALAAKIRTRSGR